MRQVQILFEKKSKSTQKIVCINKRGTRTSFTKEEKEHVASVNMVILYIHLFCVCAVQYLCSLVKMGHLNFRIHWFDCQSSSHAGGKRKKKREGEGNGGALGYVHTIHMNFFLYKPCNLVLQQNCAVEINRLVSFERTYACTKCMYKFIFKT